MQHPNLHAGGGVEYGVDCSVSAKAVATVVPSSPPASCAVMLGWGSRQ